MPFPPEPGAAWNYIRVRGLEMVNILYCPHVDAENRLLPFQTFMGRYSQVGLGCDDCCALEVVDEQWRIIACRSGAKAYRVYRRRGEVVTEILEPDDTFRPLADLLRR